MTPVTDPALLAQLNGSSSLTPVTDPAILAQLNSGDKSAVSAPVDFARSIPGGFLGGLSNALSAGGQAAQIEMGQPVDVPDAGQTKQILEQNVTGQTYQPQTKAGQYGEAVGEALGNPVSYIGPGSLPLKIGGAILSSLGSEGGAQIAQGTPYEGAARLGGGLIGGVTAGKTLGPAIERGAAAPTAAELKAAEDVNYTAARNSGVEFDPQKVATGFAAPAQQELTVGPKYAFTGGPDGTAPKTMAILDKLQNPPEGATVTAANLDTLRRQINDIAGETQFTANGPKPTSDAKAAMVLKRQFSNYLENPPQDHIVAGNPEDFVRNIKEGNGNHAALMRLNGVQQRLDNAQVNYEGSIAGRLDNQIKAQLRPILKNPKAARGYSQEELDAIRGINKGSVTSNIMSQLGRGGAGVVPLGMEIGAGVPAAVMTGGASIIPQAVVAGGLYGARKIGEAMTRNRANALVQAIAKRSPLYASRPQPAPTSAMPNRAAVVRALMNAATQ